MIQVTKLGQSNLNVKGKQRMVNTIPILEPRIFSGAGAGARTFVVNEALWSWICVTSSFAEYFPTNETLFQRRNRRSFSSSFFFSFFFFLFLSRGSLNADTLSSPSSLNIWLWSSVIFSPWTAIIFFSSSEIAKEKFRWRFIINCFPFLDSQLFGLLLSNYFENFRNWWPHSTRFPSLRCCKI